MKKLMGPLKLLILFGTGGFLYVLFELAWRARSHWTMFVVGGACFILVGLVNEIFTFEMPLVRQMMISALVVTLVEFVSGCVINLLLGWNVWDYSEMPFNIKGQICLPFTVLWFFVSAIGIILDDYLRYWWFGEEKPHYRLF